MNHPCHLEHSISDPLFESTGVEKAEYPRDEINDIVSRNELNLGTNTASHPEDEDIEDWDDEEEEYKTFVDADGLAPIVAMLGMSAVCAIAVGGFYVANKGYEYYFNNLQADRTNINALNKVLQASKLLIESDDIEEFRRTSEGRGSWLYVQKSAGKALMTSGDTSEAFNRSLTEQTLAITVLEDGLVEIRENESWPVMEDNELRYDSQGISFILDTDESPGFTDIDAVLQSLETAQIKEVNSWSSGGQSSEGGDSLVLAKRFSKDFLVKNDSNPYGLGSLSSQVVTESDN